jgi:hypothetical protein
MKTDTVQRINGNEKNTVDQECITYFTSVAQNEQE